jgi:putative hydrolases of HD superfamily
MKMAMVHDLAEAIVGDITPHCKVSNEDKFKMENVRAVSAHSARTRTQNISIEKKKKGDTCLISCLRIFQEAMDKIEATLAGNPAGKEIRELWLEYEAAETPEAKLVKDFDKFDMIMQADEYEQQHTMVSFDRLFTG